MTQRFLPTVNSNLSDILLAHKIDILQSLNCHLIGKIASFDAAKNTAQVKIQMKRQYMNSDEPVDFPLLSDCPVFVVSGGNSHLTMPIAVDDPCIVLFNDRDMDDWWYSDTVVPPASNRLHSLSDGICLVGIRPATNPIALESEPGLYSSDKKVVLKGTAAKVEATAGVIEIKNQLHSLKTLIDELFTNINALTVTCASPGNPSSIPINSAAFTTLKAKFDALLG